MTKTCDIILPVFNNAAVVGQTVAALYSQALPAGWRCRLITCDDGSTDDSSKSLAAVAIPVSWASPLLLSQPHTGAAAARNRALNKATADVLFFLGADILLRPGSLAAHLTFHELNPEPKQAALGWVAWDPRLRPTPCMEWMIHGGPQNNFDDLLGSPLADPRHFFFASHLSLKRALLGKERFPNRSDYGWEDLALGRRLASHGLRLHALPAAQGLHHHTYTITQIIRRQEAVGRGLVWYQALYPNENLLPARSPIKRLFHQVASWLQLPHLIELGVRLFGYKFSTPHLYQRLTSLFLWKGVDNSFSRKRT